MIVHPAAIGAGVPLFAPLAREVQLDATEVKPFEDGAVALRYRPSAS